MHNHGRFLKKLYNCVCRNFFKPSSYSSALWSKKSFLLSFRFCFWGFRRDEPNCFQFLRINRWLWVAPPGKVDWTVFRRGGGCGTFPCTACRSSWWWPGAGNWMSEQFYSNFWCPILIWTELAGCLPTDFKITCSLQGNRWEYFCKD